MMSLPAGFCVDASAVMLVAAVADRGLAQSARSLLQVYSARRVASAGVAPILLGNFAVILGFNRPNNRRDIRSWERNLL